MMFIIEPAVRPTKKKNKKRYMALHHNNGIGRHITYRQGKKGPYKGLVQSVYDRRKNG